MLYRLTNFLSTVVKSYYKERDTLTSDKLEKDNKLEEDNDLVDKTQLITEQQVI